MRSLRRGRHGSVAVVAIRYFPKGQEGQLELDFGDLALDILAGQAQVDAGRVDVSVPELLLKGIMDTRGRRSLTGVRRGRP